MSNPQTQPSIEIEISDEQHQLLTAAAAKLGIATVDDTAATLVKAKLEEIGRRANHGGRGKAIYRRPPARLH